MLPKVVPAAGGLPVAGGGPILDWVGGDGGGLFVGFSQSLSCLTSWLGARVAPVDHGGNPAVVSRRSVWAKTASPGGAFLWDGLG